MEKNLINVKYRNKGKLADSKPVVGRGRLSEGKIKQVQKYHGLVIHQNTVKKQIPQTERLTLLCLP